MVLNRRREGSVSAAPISSSMSAASATRTSQWRGASDACCPAWPMSLIWALILGNWTMNEVLRPERWSAPVVALGYVLVILTVVSFFQCVCTHPGAAPAAWRAAALDGAEPCVLHHSSGEPVPPRGRYYRRWNASLLAFDHHCWWIGRPVAWRNRKFFVLFVLYAAALSGYGLVLTALDLCALLQSYGIGNGASGLSLLSLLPPVGLGGPMQAAMLGIALSHMETYDLSRLAGLYVLAGFDLAATLLLGAFGAWHLRMVLRNATSIGTPEEARYDVGPAANVRQVFGRRPVLWGLPVWLDDAPEGDGIHWPIKPMTKPTTNSESEGEPR